MKCFLIGLSLCTSFTYANTSQLNVKNFNFSYKNPYGEGSATSFSRSNYVAEEAVSISVDRIGPDFKINVTGAETQEIEFQNAPELLSEAEVISINSFDLSLGEKFNMKLASGKIIGREDALNLDGVSLDCSRDLSQATVMDQMIAGCIQKMNLKAAKFSSHSNKENLISALNNAVSSVLGGTGIKSLDFKSTAGKYELSAEVQAQVSGKVKSNGQLSYDSSGSKLTVKIVEVKFGFLNITNKVFDELKKQEGPKLRVNKPFVIYSLK